MAKKQKLRANAFVAGKYGEPIRQVNIAVPRSLEQKMRAEAKARGASFAQVARDILIRHYAAA